MCMMGWGWAELIRSTSQLLLIELTGARHYGLHTKQATSVTNSATLDMVRFLLPGQSLEAKSLARVRRVV